MRIARDLTLEAAARPSTSQIAWRDVVDGAARYWLWSAMAIQDIRLRYRGSLFGPFWLTFSTMIMIGSMGVIYPHIFHTDMTTYMPYLAIGMVVWQFLQTMITDGCQTFLEAQHIILQSPMPLSIHASRLVARNFIILAHNAVIIPVMLVIFRYPIGIGAIQIVPALLLIGIVGFWLSIFFGAISARFRDIPPILANVMQVLFFVTPIFWSPEVLGRWKPVFVLNPLYAAIDVIREPLLGKSPERFSWAVLLLTTVVVSSFGFLFFARFRRRIAYWL